MADNDMGQYQMQLDGDEAEPVSLAGFEVAKAEFFADHAIYGF